MYTVGTHFQAYLCLHTVVFIPYAHLCMHVCVCVCMLMSYVVRRRVDVPPEQKGNQNKQHLLIADA